MPTTSKRIHRKLALGLLTCLVVLGAAQPSEARQIGSSGGPTGYVATPTGVCRYFNHWNRIDVEVGTPAIYAPDRYAGGGNDSAWVRYTVLVVDRYNNLERVSGTSGWAAAYDNVPARFSGAATSFLNVSQYSRPLLLVEFVGSGYSSTALVALDRILLYNGGLSPVGNVDSCSKWMPTNLW